MNDTVFQQKLLSVMTDNRYDRVIPKRRSGKLDHKNAWRVHAGAENVFKQKQERKGKEYSVVLCVDESGSMKHFGGGGYDTKFDAAVDLASYMATHLQKAGIDFAVIGFNCNVVTHKNFGSKMGAFELQLMRQEMDRNYHGCFPSGWTYAHGNHDFVAIEQGLEMLRHRTHGKILISLSDGQPACDDCDACGYDEDKHEPRNIHALIKSYPDVLSVGVGILQSSHLGSMFDHVVPIEDLADFKGKMIGFLDKNIKRG